MIIGETGERINRFAKVLVDYCLDIQKGQKLHISASDLAAPLILEVYKNAIMKGAFPIVDVGLPGMGELFYKYASKEQLQHVSEYARFNSTYFDADLTIMGGYNTKAMSGVDSSKISMSMKSSTELHEIRMKRLQNQELKWCGTQFPTHSAAQQAGMSLLDYQDFVFKACFLNDDDPIQSWKNMSEWQEKLCKFLETKKEFKVKSEDTDLVIKTEGRKWVNCDGKMNFPDGEVFTGPIENSINGHVRFSFPGIFAGKEIEDIRLTFKDGKVVDADAKVGKDLLLAMLNTDEGARYVGEFAIGTNYGIDRFTKNMLFDEKIGGTIHLAVGASLPQSLGVNKSSVHWDMLCDMKKGGEIYADDELIYKDGNFTLDLK